MSAGWLAKRMKYQLELTKVSNVSVSRRAAPEQEGQVVCFQASFRSSGLPGTSKLTSCGSTTGNCSRGTATGPQLSQWIIGIGVPQ